MTGSSRNPASNPGETLNTHWHPRALRDYRYIYAVLSRRSGGLSIGVNLHPGKQCNFRCIYCQVDRTAAEDLHLIDVDIGVLNRELGELLDSIASGDAFRYPPFDSLPANKRGVKDIAFSGDGEPTAFPGFAECVRIVAAQRDRVAMSDTAIVVITNASFFHMPWMRDGLKAIDACRAEIWAKLDAGDPDYFKRVNDAALPLERILDNIHTAGSGRDIAIQSMFMKINGVPPTEKQLRSYTARINKLLERGTRITRVLAYTIARPPRDADVTALTRNELTAITEKIRRETGLPAIPYI